MSEVQGDAARTLPLPIERDRLMLLLVAFNLGFTVFDVYLAHGMNQMQTVYMMIPFICIPLGLVPAALLATTNSRHPLIVWFHLLGMLACASVGVMGFAFHLRTVVLPGGEFVWGWVIFSAPALAPLAFSGVAMLGIIAALKEVSPGRYDVPGYITVGLGITKRRLYFVFVAFGLGAATITAALEHSQGGYENWTEWFPVVMGGACTGAALGYASCRVPSRGELAAILIMGGVAVLVGILGFTFHASADLGGTGSISIERFVHGAPLFAPMLFADLGTLMVVAAGEKHVKLGAQASEFV